MSSRAQLHHRFLRGQQGNPSDRQKDLNQLHSLSLGENPYDRPGEADSTSNDCTSLTTIAAPVRLSPGRRPTISLSPVAAQPPFSGSGRSRASATSRRCSSMPTPVTTHCKHRCAALRIAQPHASLYVCTLDRRFVGPLGCYVRGLLQPECNASELDVRSTPRVQHELRL